MQKLVHYPPIYTHVIQRFDFHWEMTAVPCWLKQNGARTICEPPPCTTKKMLCGSLHISYQLLIQAFGPLRFLFVVTLHTNFFHICYVPTATVWNKCSGFIVPPQNSLGRFKSMAISQTHWLSSFNYHFPVTFSGWIFIACWI